MKAKVLRYKKNKITKLIKYVILSHTQNENKYENKRPQNENKYAKNTFIPLFTELIAFARAVKFTNLIPFLLPEL